MPPRGNKMKELLNILIEYINKYMPAPQPIKIKEINNKYYK